METVDYSIHRPVDDSWREEYEKKLGRSILMDFTNMVNKWLMLIKPGQTFDITQKKMITAKNRDLFIKTACLFISKGNDDYYFSGDYTKIFRKAKGDREEIAEFYERLDKKRQKTKSDGKEMEKTGD